jgi:hypothetical protein
MHILPPLAAPDNSNARAVLACLLALLTAALAGAERLR